MPKTLLIARREFASTVFTKGFVIGVLMVPLFIVIAIAGVLLAMREGGPKIEGSVAIIDHSPEQRVAKRLAERFSPEALKEEARKAGEEIKGAMRQVTPGSPAGGVKREFAASMAAQAAEQAILKLGGLKVETLPENADPAKEKDAVINADIHARANDPSAPLPRLMMIVVPETSVLPKPGDGPTGFANNSDAGLPEYSPFEVYSSPKLDFEISERVQRRVSGAIVDARMESDPRLAIGGVGRNDIRALMADPESKTVSVTKSGEKASAGVAQQFIPMGFLLLMFMSIMVSSQALLTSTIEEKSSRVMEVLLSAVSPMQLMTGKILGQMAVGLVMIGVYSGLGIVGMIYTSLQDSVDPLKLLYLPIYFVIAYFTIASMMAAVGSAVSELREAQTLMTPVMMFMIIPWILWLPISRAPNSMFAQVLSFVPGCNAFVMVTRLFGSEPVPTWQIPASIVVGLVGAFFFAWCAAKVFRIGVLMYGKPPDWQTLIRWVRMA
jgi:ABC-type Na+ efflux pump permease subunit